MQGLMSQYPLTLTHVLVVRNGCSPRRAVATVTAGGIDADHLRRVGRAHPPLAARARHARDLRGRPRRHLRLEHRAPPRALLRRALQRPRPAHAEHPAVPRDIVYIANHAEDEVVFVDRSLLKVFWPLVDRLKTVRHVVVMDDGGDDGCRTTRGSRLRGRCWRRQSRSSSRRRGREPGRRDVLHERHDR